MKKMLFSLMLLSMFSCSIGGKAPTSVPTQPQDSPEQKLEDDDEDVFESDNPSPEAKKEAKVEFEPADENWEKIDPAMLVDTSISNDVYLYFSKDSNAKAQFKIKSDGEQIESVTASILSLDGAVVSETLQPHNGVYSYGIEGLSGTINIKVKCKSRHEKTFAYYRIDRKVFEVLNLLQLILNQKNVAFYGSAIFGTSFFTSANWDKPEGLDEINAKRIHQRYGGTTKDKKAYFFINLMIIKLDIALKNIDKLFQYTTATFKLENDLNYSTRLIIRMLYDYLNSFVANDQNGINIKIKSSKVAIKLIEMLIKKGAKVNVIEEIGNAINAQVNFVWKLDGLTTTKMFFEMLSNQKNYYVYKQKEIEILNEFNTQPEAGADGDTVKVLAEVEALRTKMLNGVLKQ